MFDFDQDMKLAFLEEAQALLDETEAAFIALDEGDRSPDLIDRIFRLAHNFKGSAKTVGLQHLSDFGHAFEDALTKVKSGVLIPDKDVCTVLLQTLDHFKSYVAGLKEDLKYIHDTEAIIATLNSLANDTTPQNSESVETNISTMSSSISIESIDVPSEIAVAPPAQASVAETDVATAIEPVAAPPIELAATRSSGTPKAKPAEEENLKVNRKKLDTLLNLIGELVVNQSMVAGFRDLQLLNSEPSMRTISAMEKIVLEIQSISMALRMTPIAPLFQKLKRIARDASGSLSKTIQFQTEGEHVEVDKIVLEKISDPLTHLVRNAVDHGIETDEERTSAGKDSVAVVTLSAQQKEDRIIITLADNGRGMNAKKLIAKAIEKNLIPASAQLSDEEAYALIFKPGFSTKEQVTDMSGRGVGMDVVQRAIEDLKGHIQIQTKLGEGSKFTISLPLSMSILTGMVVGIDQKKYVVPISQLVETVELSHFRIETSTEKGRMFNLRGDIIPVYSMSRILHSKTVSSVDPTKRRTGLITIYNGKKYSFEIDEIFGQQQIVLKKLGHEMRNLPGIVAGAILNTGEPGLVLDLSDFIEKGVHHAA